MPRKRDESRVAEAARLAASGKTQPEVSEALGVPLRTIQRWPVKWPQGRPRVAASEGSRWTRRRREREAGKAKAQSAREAPGPEEEEEAEAGILPAGEEHAMTLTTEKGSENYQPRPGQMGTRTYWIAYPEHVAGYGHVDDRISRAWGSGKTRKEALANAEASARSR